MADRLRDPERLRRLRDTGLLDAGADTTLDRLTGMAARLIGAPTSVVSLVTEDRQVFAGQAGLGGAAASVRETPLSQSFCRYVVADDAPLIITDAATDERVCDHPAVADGVRAYAGFPLRTPEGQVLGSFCVVDTQPRDWTGCAPALPPGLPGSAST